MKPRFTLYDFSDITKPQGNKVINQKQGHFSLFRSLFLSEWSHDPFKLAVWVRLLSEAAFRQRTVEFRGVAWTLNPGELVTTCRIIGSHILDSNKKPINKRQVLRILKFFERENMIQLNSYPSALVVFIINYCDYQTITLSEKEGTPTGTRPGIHDGPPGGTPPTSEKCSIDAGLWVISDNAYGTPNGTPKGTPHGTPDSSQNNTDTNTDLKKISSSRTKNIGSRKGSRSTILAERAVSSPSGKFWGTSEDLRLAQWIFSLVSVIDGSAKEPSWASWSNDIRLLRESKNCTHRIIAETFKWANCDGFWQTNVLSPYKLRRHWENIFPKSQQAKQKTSTTRDQNELDFDNSDWAEGLTL